MEYLRKRCGESFIAQYVQHKIFESSAFGPSSLSLFA